MFVSRTLAQWCYLENIQAMGEQVVNVALALPHHYCLLRRHKAGFIHSGVEDRCCNVPSLL